MSNYVHMAAAECYAPLVAAKGAKRPKGRAASEEPMICPVCRLELGVERQAGEVVLTYSFGDWVRALHATSGAIRCCAPI